MASPAVAPVPDSVAQVAESVQPSAKVTEIASTPNAILARNKETEEFVFIAKHQNIALEASTLIELLVSVDDERVYGVLSIIDEELEVLFGTAFLAKEFPTLKITM